MRFYRKLFLSVISLIVILGSIVGQTKAIDQVPLVWLYKNNSIEAIDTNELETHSLSLIVDMSYLSETSSLKITISNDLEVNSLSGNYNTDLMIVDGTIIVSTDDFSYGIEQAVVSFDVTPLNYGKAYIEVRSGNSESIINVLPIQTVIKDEILNDNKDGTSSTDEGSISKNLNQKNNDIDSSSQSGSSDKNLGSNESDLPLENSVLDQILPYSNIVNAAQEKVNVTDYFNVPELTATNKNVATVDPNNSDTVIITHGKNQEFGVMWSKFKVDLLNDFEIDAQVSQVSTSAGKRADGIAFVLQNDPNGSSAFGTPGWGLGVYGSKGGKIVSNALAFEMDTYMNGPYVDHCTPVTGKVSCINSQTENTNQRYYPGHIAVVETNRDIGAYVASMQSSEVIHNNAHQLTLTSQGDFISDFVPLNVKWNAATQTITYVYNNTYTITYKVQNLQQTFGGTEVYLGFTGSTGGYVSKQYVRFNILPGAPVKVNYIDIDTNQRLTDEVTKEGLLGADWTSTKLDFTNYEFVALEGPASGKHTGTTQTVTYKYRYKPVSLNVKKYANGDANYTGLEGAKFQICYYDNQTQNTGIDSGQCISKYEATTAANGIANFILKRPGGYYIQELQAPEGFELRSDKLSFTLNNDGTFTYNGQTTVGLDNIYTILFGNDLKPFTLVVNKHDENGNALSGAAFKLLKDSQEIGTIGMNESISSFTFENLKAGSYTLIEVSAPEYYYPLLDPINIEIDVFGNVSVVNNDDYVYEKGQGNSPNRITLNVENQPIPRYPLEFYKVNKNDQPLEGVKFSLYKFDEVQNDFVSIPIESVSLQDGLVSFGILDFGKYKLVETSTVSGYELPLGYWIIDYDDTQEAIKDRLNISAAGDSLPPAFKLNTMDNKEVFTLVNYKLQVMPKVGKLDYFLFPIIGILTCGFAGIYLVLTEKNRKDKKDKKAENGRGII